VWFGAGDGQIAVRDLKGAVTVRKLPVGGAARLFEDPEGVVWVGGDDGISRIAGATSSASRARRASPAA
jgi:ligand-binding sensor domain-containing protein